MYILEYNKIRQKAYAVKEVASEKIENYVYKAKKYPWYYRVFAVAIVILFLWFGGIFSQLGFYLFVRGDFAGLGKVNILNPILCIGSFFMLGLRPFLFGFLMCDAVICVFSWWWFRNHKFRPVTVDIQRGERTIRHVLNGGSLASGHPAFIEDMEEKYIVTAHPERYDTPVYGKWKDEDDDRFIIAKKPRRLSDNQNSIIFGAGGSRKTRDFVVPYISQLAKQGIHMIITDPSTEIYAKTYYRLKDEGYTIKVINTINPLLSNGWNFIGDIGDDTDFAFQFASALVENSKEPGAKTDQYWDDTKVNFLTALIIYVNTLPRSQANIKTIIRLMNTDSKILKSKFQKLPHTHPGRMHFESFWNADTNREKIKANLGLSLKIFYQPLLAEMLSTDDIHVTDFLKPQEEEKIALFFITSEQSDAYSMVAGLFMDSCFKVLSEKVKFFKNQHLPNPVHFVCDEFANIGHIVQMGKKMSVSRKYWFVINMIFQSMPQFLNRYDENEVNEIIGNCNNKLLLSADENVTAEYFEKFFGKMEVLHFQDTTAAPITNSTASVRGSIAAQPIWPQDDIISLDSDYMLIKAGKAPVADIKKVDYTELPEFQQLYAKMGGAENAEVSISDFKGTIKDPLGKYKKKVYEKQDSYNEESEGVDDFDEFFFDDGEYFDENVPDDEDETKAPEKSEKKESSRSASTVTPTNVDLLGMLGYAAAAAAKKPKPNHKEKKIISDSLYNVDCSPKKLGDFKTITEKTAKDAQMQLTSFFENEDHSLESINAIPAIPKHINWDPLLAQYKAIISRDETNRVRFNNNNLGELDGQPVTTVSFKSSAEFIDIYLPDIQLRAVGESINISELTNNILSKIKIPEPFRLDCWIIVANSNGKTKKAYSGDVIRISKSHITLIPHFAEKE